MGDVILELDGAVLRATIDRPEARNAISPAVVDGLEEAVRRARDADARVLVIRGTGGTFCAGADLAWVLSTINQPGGLEDGGAFATVIGRLNDVLEEIEALPFASVAVVDGFALAGGCEVLLACDVVVADEAARIGDRHLELGLLPGGGGSVRLHKALTPARSHWLLLSGEMISGREAADWGLVTRAVPRGELDEVAEAMIARLASRSADALAGAKEMIGAVRDVPVPDGVAAERRIFLDHMGKSEDVRAALARFLQPKPAPEETPMAEELDLPWCFDDEHLAWQKTIQEFCQRVVAPGVIQRDLDGQLDPDLVREVGRLGAFGLRVPEEYGGSGADLRSMCIAAEEFSVIDSSLAVTIHVQAISAALFHHLASEDLRAEFLPTMASGETFCAFGLTEPTGGSDAGNIGTRAVRDGSDWVISGAKQFITNSGTPFSKYVTLFASHERDGAAPAGSRPPISAFLVPLDAPGVTVGPKYPKMGWRSSDTHPLYFEDVRVPAHHLLGQEGRGYREALAFLTWARIPIAAMSAGLARGCLEATLEFTTSRESFGKPLTSHQAVAFGIADLSAMTDTCRLLTYDAAWEFDTGRPIEREAAVSKLMASELANQVAYKASHLHGGYGFMDDSHVSRHYRDARILTIGEGTSEVQRMLIARGLGLPV